MGGVKAQDRISNTNGYGVYPGTDQNVIINNDAGMPVPIGGVTDPNQVTGVSKLNFVGGFENDVDGTSSASALNNLVYGRNNFIEKGSNNIALGRSNDVLSSSNSGAIGKVNFIENSVEAYSLGGGTRIIGGEEKVVIGFGDASSGNPLTSVGSKSITMGTYNTNTNAAYNTLNIRPPSTAPNFSAPVTGIGDPTPNAKFSVRNIGGNSSSTILNLTDNGGDRVLTVKNNGNVGIGTTSPGSKVQIVGNGTTNSTSALDVQDNNNNSLLFVRDDVLVGVNTTSQIMSNTEIFQVDGEALSMSWNTFSDKKMKTDIKVIKNPIDKVQKIRGVTYQFSQNKYPKLNCPKGEQAGVIAQEINKILPQAVTEPKEKDGLYAVNYDAIVPLLIETNKAQQKQIEKLREKTKRVDQLEQKLQEQKAKHQELENGIKKLEKLVKEEYKNESKLGLGNDQRLKGNKLYQNSPNPFSQETTIKYRLTEKVNDAQIVVTNSQGDELSRFNISGSGYGAITIQGGNLKPGNYFYSLLVDGKHVANRKMVLIHK